MTQHRARNFKTSLQLTVFASLMVLLSSTSLSSAPSNSTSHSSRIKDIVSFEGVRDNQLVGYGLVVGLNGTGDGLTNAPFTRESLVSMLERLGVNIRDQLANLKTKNVAAVMVTANLPPFSRQGARIDISVSAMGDAKDLLGGTLLVTPLMGADGDVYAVAQGPITTGSFQASGSSGSSITKGVPTNGKIPNGAIIEKEIGFELKNQDGLKLSLFNPDFTTAKRIADAVNVKFGHVADALDPTTVQLQIPAKFAANPVAFITEVEQMPITPDLGAKVVIDEANGVIVMGKNVRISEVAVSHGNLTIKITETPQVSQPNPFSIGGTTEIVARTGIDVKEDSNKKMVVLDGGTTLQQLVDGLNALGVSPRDMITILETIKSAGALQAEIEVK
ncbi:flagellar basal body P-ring protein FlgI [Candidatus Bealeia paramacronuclearis]